MKNKFYDALHEIKAEDKLKGDTYKSVYQKAYIKKKNRIRQFALVTALFAVIIFAGLFSHQLYFTKAAYLDIDVNPSIELTLNRFDRVIQVHAYNDDGKKVLDAVDIRHKTYKEALDKLIDQMSSMGYIADTSTFTATMQMESKDKERKKLDALRAYLDSVLQDGEKTTSDDVFLVDSDTKTHAHEQNLTPAKYLAILELQNYDATATFDSCRNHSLSEIEEEIHTHESNAYRHGKKGENTVESEDANENGNGNGNGNGNSDGDGHHSHGH